jgi:hypothetical protein
MMKIIWAVAFIIGVPINFALLMKKLLVIFLMLVYGLSSTGATLYLHYCCGKLDNISFSSTGKKNCPANAVTAKGCCDSKHVELKVKGDQEPAAKWILTQTELSILVGTVSYLLVPSLKVPVHAYATGPPVVNASVPLFISNCVFRI